MLSSTVLLALRHLLLGLLLLAFLLVRPCSSTACLDGNIGLHDRQKQYDTASKAHLSAVVFHGTLLSVLVERDGTIRTAFGVKKVLKSEGMRQGTVEEGEVEVVYFQRQRTGQECVLSVNEDSLLLGTQYIVFGRPLKGLRASISATAFPVEYEKRSLREVRKVLCKDCAKPPSIEGLKNIRVIERRKLRLHCRLSGNPIPWVEWYKDGKKVEGKRRFRVRTKRRISRLVIRHVRLHDSGEYECRAGNVVQRTPVTAKAIVTVTKKTTTKKPSKSNTTASSLWPTEPCPNSDFCLNGGTCIFYRDVREYVCQCADGYSGVRCAMKVTALSIVPRDTSDCVVTIRTFEWHWEKSNPSDLEEQYHDTTKIQVVAVDRDHNHLLVTVVVLFVVLFCINWVTLFVCWLCCFRRQCGYSGSFQERKLRSRLLRKDDVIEEISLEDEMQETLHRISLPFEEKTTWNENSEDDGEKMRDDQSVTVDDEYTRDVCVPSPSASRTTSEHNLGRISYRPSPDGRCQEVAQEAVVETSLRNIVGGRDKRMQNPLSFPSSVLQRTLDRVKSPAALLWGLRNQQKNN